MQSLDPHTELSKNSETGLWFLLPHLLVFAVFLALLSVHSNKSLIPSSVGLFQTFSLLEGYANLKVDKELR
jgi:hypothetical protein